MGKFLFFIIGGLLVIFFVFSTKIGADATEWHPHYQYTFKVYGGFYGLLIAVPLAFGWIAKKLNL